LELPATKLKDHYGRDLLARAKIDRGRVRCGDIITGASVCIEKAPQGAARMRMTLSGNSGPKLCTTTGEKHPYKPSTDSLYLARLAIAPDGQVNAVNLEAPLTTDEVLRVLQHGRLVGHVAYGGDALQVCPTCGVPVVSVAEACACNVVKQEEAESDAEDVEGKEQMNV
jgi:hypothetical protein